jgi:hypothetical protein
MSGASLEDLEVSFGNGLVLRNLDDLRFGDSDTVKGGCRA